MAQGQVVRLADDVLQVSSRVGRRQVDAMAAAGQAQGDGGSDGRLADAALAHGEDDLALMGFQVVDDGLQGLDPFQRQFRRRFLHFPFEQGPDVVQAGDVVRPQGNLEARQIGDGFGYGLQGGLLFFV